MQGMKTAVGAAMMACLGLGTVAAQGKFSTPQCPDAAESQFKYVPLVTRPNVGGTKGLATDNNMAEPIHMALDLQADNKVDVYFTQRDGTVKKFAGATNALTTVGKVDVSNNGEMGLTGIALDPQFKTNGWVYLFFAPPANNELHLSRYTIANGTFNVATEKRILTYRKVSSAHMGGAMAFDSNGDLWISSGNDGSDYPSSYSESSEGGSSEASSGNMNDLRGGVMRIHPDNSAKGYTIPAGNFGEYWSKYFKDKGNATLSAQYADPAQVKPELYVKGTRNAYSIAVDTVHHWVATGSIGINVTTSISEAHFLLTRPAFIGYPYFAGGFGGAEPGTGYYNLWSGEGGANFSASHPGLSESPAGPVNNSKWNTGPKQLPPVFPGMHSYLRGTVGGAAITGSFYYYNPASTSTIKFPPNFDGVWSITDWVQNDNVKNPAGGGFNGVKIFKVKPTGDGLLDSLKWFKNMGIIGPLDMQFGPDGALYVLNYGNVYFGTMAETKIARIEYTGTCHPTVALARKDELPHGLFRAGTVTADMAGTYSLSVRDLQGRELARLDALTGHHSWSIRELVPAGTPGGLLTVTLSNAQGTERFRIFKD